MTALKYLDSPKQAERKAPPPTGRRSGGLLSYVRPGFKLPANWQDIPEADGDIGLADK
jgi:hypothetical protein